MNDTCKDEYQEGEDITDRVYVRRRSVTDCLCIHCGEDFDESRGVRHPRAPSRTTGGESENGRR